ncbi:zinc ABC transporter substrate-binding protein [Pontibacter sp. JAM-7]|uniref:zinc ABC transporter substrate-binding protein n=1 Tax=Pontibacter sp. JAM-7 TaxID=3366581 RepID=UPI003AF52940
MASIRPVQLIADSLLLEVGQSEVLVPAGSSPHHFSLKPSQLKALYRADLVVWIGPSLEPFLQRPLQTSSALQLQWLHDEAIDQIHEHDAGDGHQHAGLDPHIWLDPDAVLTFAARLRQQLQQLRPAQAEKIEQNYQRFVATLSEADEYNRVLLQPLRNVGFVVFHDAFSRLVAHYGLNQVAYLAVEPGMPPGARKTAAIRRLLRSGDARCIFVEPQFEAGLITRLIDGLTVTTATLDPLASDLAPEADYAVYLQQLGQRLQHCLSGI